MIQVSTALQKVFGTQNDRELKALRPLVGRINDLEPQFKALNDSQLKAMTQKFRERVEKGETLDALLPEAFAVIREAATRVLGMRHYDVQLIGGITLHKGRIAEMKTGEGKTLVATLPCYLNGLSGKGVHVVTVNDYLARRDSEWMGTLHRWLGLDVGLIVHGLNDKQRQQAYGKDITYGTNNEYGFDYLRDNMKFRLEDYVQRDLNFAIVDEVDSILIDEARTPLIISGPSEQSTDLYGKINRKVLTAGLKADDDYTIDEKSKTAALSLNGVSKMEEALSIDNLYDPQNIEVLHHVNQAVRAQVLYKKDVDYVVQDGQVMIVDEFTGRLMPGRRWSDGLHQAIEAKEGVTIEGENQTLASITFQNYFRMYNKLSGMTGTADTEATEFKQIYKLDVTVIPTNRPIARLDQKDQVFKSKEQKYVAIASEIKSLQEKGQPVLVGTASVESSEEISTLLNKQGIKHNVLNAKQHEREAHVVAQAGRLSTITIATNMAGRGTDIVLGGNPDELALGDLGTKPKNPEELDEWNEKLNTLVGEYKTRCSEEQKKVKELGGLFILGTERHESRRIDNQLRGRAGRQGDPGESRFYLSLDDNLMRIFGGERIKKFMEDDVAIEHKWINRSIENAQKKVEGHNYDIRKHLLEYDDVMNQQRQVIYSWRKEVLNNPNLSPMLFSMVEDIADQIAEDFFPKGKLKRVNGRAGLDEKELNDALKITFSFKTEITENDITPFNKLGLKKLITSAAEKMYSEKRARYGDEVMEQLENMIMLQTIDTNWKDHLLAMDHLREGVGLQGYGQKDPLIEYKKQGFAFFEMMMGQITGDVVRKLYAVEVQSGAYEMDHGYFPDQDAMEYNVDSSGGLVSSPFQAPTVPIPGQQPMQQGFGGAPMEPQQPFIRDGEKVGRNDPCPCGSGKKYKKCHGA